MNYNFTKSDEQANAMKLIEGFENIINTKMLYSYSDYHRENDSDHEIYAIDGQYNIIFDDIKYKGVLVKLKHSTPAHLENIGSVEFDSGTVLMCIGANICKDNLKKVQLRLFFVELNYITDVDAISGHSDYHDNFGVSIDKSKIFSMTCSTVEYINDTFELADKSSKEVKDVESIYDNINDITNHCISKVNKKILFSTAAIVLLIIVLIIIAINLVKSILNNDSGDVFIYIMMLGMDIVSGITISKFDLTEINRYSISITDKENFINFKNEKFPEKYKEYKTISIK